MIADEINKNTDSYIKEYLAANPDKRDDLAKTVKIELVLNMLCS